MQHVIDMLERMASSGTAPMDGCAAFGVGYEDAFNRLRQKYIVERFSRGSSAEKFVVGPFGSGKTHFLRQLMELGREAGCATAEVTLDKSVDYTDKLQVYQLVAETIRVPGQTRPGMRGVIAACAENVRAAAPAPMGTHMLRAWAAGLPDAGFELATFGEVAKTAVEAYLADEAPPFRAACRWLQGEVMDKVIAGEVDRTVVQMKHAPQHGQQALLSLFQLVRMAGFTGSIICFDEAEQGLAVNKAKTQRILSMFQSDINSLADLAGGSALVVYAITPDLLASMMNFAALQDRVEDAEPGAGFFDGVTLAKKIDLTRRGDPLRDIEAIGRRLTDLLYERTDREIKVPQADVLARVAEIAADVVASDITTSNRRAMVKRTCSMLLHVYETGSLDGARPITAAIEDEV